MMKKIKYKFLSCQINKGTEEKPILEDVIFEKDIPWSEPNEEIAKAEAYNGEYEIVDDGQPDPASEPTTDDILNALLGVSA